MRACRRRRGAAQGDHAGDLCRAARRHGLYGERRAARLHSDARPGLRHRGGATARRRVAVAHRRGGASAPPRSSRRRRASRDAVAFAGFSGATFTNASNAGADLRALSIPSRSGSRTASPATAIDRPAVRAAAIDRGGLHHRHSAAAGARASAIPAASRCSSRSGSMRSMDRVLGCRLPAHGAMARQRRSWCGVFTTFSASGPQIYLEIDRDQGAHAGCADRQYLRDPAGQSRHGLCQRFQCFRPGLPGARPGRPEIPRRARGHPAAQGALGQRRAGAARHAGRDPRCHRARPGAALQHVHLGAGAGQRRRRASRRPPRSTRWRNWPARSCRRA